MEDQRPPVDLTDAIKAVRSALLAAVMDAGSEEVQFTLRSVDLDFAVDFRPTAVGRAQVLVLSARADESAQPVLLHRLRVTLHVEDIERRPWRAPARPSPSLPSPPPAAPGRPFSPPRGLGGDRPGDRSLPPRPPGPEPTSGLGGDHDGD